MPSGVKGGHSVFWREFGKGPGHAVLLHCALAHSKIWSRLAGGLSDTATMIAPDMPGHGRSDAWDGRSDIFDQVTAIGTDCLADGGHLIGHSFGAVVALRVASMVPDKVKSLTLIEPVFFAAARHSAPAVLESYLKQDAAFSTALCQEDWFGGAQAFTHIWGDGRSWDTLSKQDRQTFARLMPFIRDTEPALMQDTAGLLAQGVLESITCPTCLIRGDVTNPVIEAIHSTLSNRIPQAKDHVIAGAGHMVPVSHPDAVAALIRPLLAAA